MKKRILSARMVWVGILVLALAGSTAYAQPKPIQVGFSLGLSGSLASAGKAALLSMQECAADFNARGGVLGRPVKLVYYDDHSRPADVPAIYTKLITVDKVDFVIGPYATGFVKSALPIIMEHKMIAPSLFALQANKDFNYKYYFQMQPIGPDGVVNIAEGFFEVAAAQTPKPKTVAILAEDNEMGVLAQEAAEILSAPEDPLPLAKSLNAMGDHQAMLILLRACARRSRRGFAKQMWYAMSFMADALRAVGKGDVADEIMAASGVRVDDDSGTIKRVPKASRVASLNGRTLHGRHGVYVHDGVAYACDEETAAILPSLAEDFGPGREKK